MSKYIVAISIDKVQTFMYSCIKKQSQQSQLDDNTLKSVINASCEVKQVFYEIIKDKFDIKEKDIVHYISGKIFFYTTMNENDIVIKLKEIYKLYYYANKGQIQIRYTYSQDDITDKTEIVKKYSEYLKSIKTSSNIIKDNKDVMFSIPKSIKDHKKEYNDYCVNNNDKNCYDSFVSGLDEINSNNGELKKSKIAIIKCDINNMGIIMKSINGDAYFQMSKLIDDKVSIDNIHEYFAVDKKLRVCPFYIAGDDIFLATEIKSIFDVVSVFNKLIEDINNEINVFEYTTKKFSISIGITIVDSTMPLRYYYDIVEEQLNYAKTNGKKKSNISTSIGFNGQLFYIYDKNNKDSKDKEKPNNWFDFKHKVDLLLKLKSISNNNDIVSRSYFHKLINIMEDGELLNKQKLFNQLIYNLIPNNSSTQIYFNYDVKVELILKTMLMRNLLTSANGLKGKQISINDKIINNFKSILKLYMLFIDERYNDSNFKQSNNKIKSIAEIQKYGYSDKEISSILFTKPCNFIFNSYNNRKFFNVFVKKDFYEIQIKNDKVTKTSNHEIQDEDNKVIKISYYKILKIQKSLFYKIKKLLEDRRISFEQIGAMIENVCTNKEVIHRNCDNKELVEEVQMSRKLNFDKTEFLKYANSNLNDEFIDSVMIFYECERSRLNFKKIIKRGKDDRKKVN